MNYTPYLDNNTSNYHKFNYKKQIIMRKNFIAIVLCCLLVACSSTNIINNDVKTGETCSAEAEAVETTEDALIEVANVGFEHMLMRWRG